MSQSHKVCREERIVGLQKGSLLLIPLQLFIMADLTALSIFSSVKNTDCVMVNNAYVSQTEYCIVLRVQVKSHYSKL